MSLVLALPVALMAQAVSAPGWLAGCWQLQAGNRETMEMWTAPAGGLMLGASRTLVNGALREYEQIVLKLEGGKLVYTASPSGQRTTSFSSTAVTDSSFTVENLQHDFPQRIIYRRRGTDSLIARIEGPSPDGRTRGFDYAMRRTSCDGQAGREGYVTTDDSVRLYYRIVGDGAETVIVPVGLYLETLLAPLARPGRRLVFYDPRHRGRSGRGDLSRATLDRQIADLEQLRAALKIDRMAIIGWSGYGMEMAVYTIRHPDRVTRLVQVAPVPPAARIFAQAGGDRRAARTDTAALTALERRFRAGEFATDGGGAAYCRARERLTAPANFVDPTLVARVPDVCRWENEWPSNLGPYFDAFLPSLGDFDWRDQIARVSIPRLVIHGREDGIPLAGARAWVEGFPAARLLVLSPAGHFPMLERPAEFFAAVNAFLAGDWPSGATAGSNER